MPNLSLHDDERDRLPPMLVHIFLTGGAAVQFKFAHKTVDEIHQALLPNERGLVSFEALNGQDDPIYAQFWQEAIIGRMIQRFRVMPVMRGQGGQA